MASKSVNVPTNNAIKEKDVNSKLQLYGIFAGTSHISGALALDTDAPSWVVYSQRDRMLIDLVPQHFPRARSQR